MVDQISKDSIFITSVGRQILPVGLLAMLFAVFTVFLVIHSSQRQNEIATQGNAQLIETAINHMAESLAIYASDYTYWNEATEKVVAEPDLDWIRDNITGWSVEGLGLSGAAIYGENNRVIEGSGRWVGEGDEESTALTGSLRALIDDARKRASPEGNPEDTAWGFIADSAGIHLAAASAFVWELDESEEEIDVPMDNETPVVLVFFQTLDKGYLEAIGEQFILSKLRLRRPGNRLDNGSRYLHASNGQVLGILTWHFDLPGDQMLDEMLLPFAIGLAVLGLIFWFLLSRAARAAWIVTDYQHSLERQTEALIVAKNEANAANREKSRFLATMSHELRTPLNAIIGFSDIMRQDTFKSMPVERFQNYAQDIHQSGHYLLALINDVLDMSKIEAQRFELFEDILSLDDIVQDSVKLIAGSAGNKSLTLDCPETKAVLYADPKAMTQIFVNLLTNAVKFTPEGGTIRVTADMSRTESVDISVSDTGVGMSEEELKKAMTAFGQTKASRESNMQGTGLGLNITRSLIELHGGKLVVESEPGKGTDVILRLPRSRLVEIAGRKVTDNRELEEATSEEGPPPQPGFHPP